jgi:L-ribulose-5-phosphate 3-epimerase
MDFGILQGRLSPSPDGRFQFFPPDWRKEFSVASRLGFSALEWLVDWPDWETNPFLDPSQEKDILRASDGVPINSVCGDYFMKYRLDGAGAAASERMAVRLVQAAAKLTRRKLLLFPMLEANAYKTEAEKARAAACLKSAVREAETLGVRIGFETEMPVKDLMGWLERLGSPAVGAYYDIGNCTSYGFDCPADLKALGKCVFGVHVKDRKKGSPQSVTLGTGDARIADCLKALKEIGFEGTPVLQAWRGEDYLKDATEQLAYLKRSA